MSEAAALVAEPRPALESLRQLVVNSVRSPHSRRAYGKALDGFFAWYAEFPRPPFSNRDRTSRRDRLCKRSPLTRPLSRLVPGSLPTHSHQLRSDR